jgi:Domain of unknown function (DUF222)/HNH endonuclease
MQNMRSSRGGVALLQEGLAALRATDATDLPAAVLREELLALLRVTRSLEAAVADRLAAFEACGGHEADCAATPAAWLRRELHLDRTDASDRVAAARVLRGLPGTAAALAAGDIGPGHVQVLAGAARRVGADVLTEAEPVLLALAKTAPPRQLRLAVDRLAAAVDADDDRDAAALAVHEDRYLHLTPGFQGGMEVTGRLDEAGGRLVQAMLTALGQPAPLPDGTPDPRTRGQRAADALVEAATTVLNLGDTPVVGKLPVAVTLVTDLPTLRAEAPSWAPSSPLATIIRDGFGQPALQRLLCAADVTPALVTDWGVPLALGRRHRLASPDQVKALWLRDGGCVMPGCTNTRVQAHHIVPWHQGGSTDLNDLALVCNRDHTLLHEHGWTLEHDPHRPGLLHWRPPDDRPPRPACHRIDRDPGATTPLW